MRVPIGLWAFHRSSGHRRTWQSEVPPPLEVPDVEAALAKALPDLAGPRTEADRHDVGHEVVKHRRSADRGAGLGKASRGVGMIDWRLVVRRIAAESAAAGQAESVEQGRSKRRRAGKFVECVDHGLFTVTLRNVAGISVLSPPWFWAMKSAFSSFSRSAERPSFDAASKAFIVGP